MGGSHAIPLRWRILNMGQKEKEASHATEDLTRPSKVLIIEDDHSTALSLKTFLEDHGYDSTCATSAKEGLEMIKRLQPDLVLLDIMMEKP